MSARIQTTPDHATPVAPNPESGGLLDVDRQVLIALTRGTLEAWTPDLADPRIRWEWLAATARDHKVGPLIHRRLDRLRAETRLPPASYPVIDEFRALYAHNLARNTEIFAELARVLASLRRAGIPTIALKGAAMAPMLYGDIGLRFMYDLDLLVPVEHRERALAGVSALGYAIDPGVPADLRAKARRSGLVPRGTAPLDATQTAAVYARHHFHYYLRRPGQSFPLEIHWHITKPGGGLDIREFWSAAQPAAAHGLEILTLRPEHLLLHLCVHLAANAYRKLRLIRFVDLHVAIDRQAIDWDLVTYAARHHRVERLVRVALGLTRAILGVPLPREVMRGGSAGERVATHLLGRWWQRDLGPGLRRPAPLSRTLLWSSLGRRTWTDPATALYRTVLGYPENNRFLPPRHAGSEVMNLVYALHPARLRALIGPRSSPPR